MLVPFNFSRHWVSDRPMGVGVADVVKASILVVEIAAVGVRIPLVPATKMDVGMTPA